MIKKFLLFLIVVLLVFALDQGTKIAVENSYQVYESHSIIGNFFRITYIRNEGVAFGILSGATIPFKNVLFFIVQLIALVSIVIYYIKSQKTFLLQLSFGFIIGGALGNTLDRIRLGEVIDFLDFGIDIYRRWFTFNIADSAISVGVVLLAILMIKEEKNVPSNRDNP